MKEFFKFVLSFLPWITFGVIAGPSLLRLEVALGICLILSIVVGFKQLQNGFVLTWGTFLFFLLSSILVIAFKNVWIMKHMGILAPATLASIAWLSILLGKPFVLQYARENTSKERWDDPIFIAGCRHMTIVWGSLFLFSTAVAVAKYAHIFALDWMYSFFSVSTVVGGMLYTEWFKKKSRNQ